jgi:hypothetical protein
MGQWAVWAITELEMADDLTMLKSKPLYPSPIVRLSLLSAVADRLKLDGRAALQGLNPERITICQPHFDQGTHQLCRIAAEDMRLVEDVAAAVVENPLAGLGRFDQWCDWRAEEFQDGGVVYHWKEGFCGREALRPERTLRAARLIASGAVAAWAEITDIEDSVEHKEALAKLAEDMVPMIVQCREEGTRAARGMPLTDTQALGGKLARLLLDADSETLGIG